MSNFSVILLIGLGTPLAAILAGLFVAFIRSATRD